MNTLIPKMLCYKDAFMVKESMLKSWTRGM